MCSYRIQDSFLNKYYTFNSHFLCKLINIRFFLSILLHNEKYLPTYKNETLNNNTTITIIAYYDVIIRLFTVKYDSEYLQWPRCPHIYYSIATSVKKKKKQNRRLTTTRPPPIVSFRSRNCISLPKNVIYW